MRTHFRAALAGAAVLTLTFTPVIADATPGRGVTLSEDAPNPGCDFQ